MKNLSAITYYLFYPLLLSFILLSCNTTPPQQNRLAKDSTTFKIYSQNVRDSFYISVQLPLAYHEQPKKKYPVVVISDANFFFPMLAATLRQYEQGGLLPPLILVGIGYRSFKEMDSLRQRDYLYPKAIASDEMKAPGGGQNFYRFITTELLPHIDHNYPTLTTDRTLMGHSFGGYFTLYALLEQLNTKRSDLKNFVAASPSLWYNNYYMLQLSNKLKTYANTDTLSIHLSVGSLEDPKWSVAPVEQLTSQLSALKSVPIRINSTKHSDLDHMDVGMISYIRGLEKIYNK